MKLGVARERYNHRQVITRFVVVALLALMIITGVVCLAIRLNKPADKPKAVSQTKIVPKPNNDCHTKYCVAITVNGDLLFHPGLWNQFRTANGFDFTELFAAMGAYYTKDDINICNFETPIAPDGGPYTGYPVFAIPPQVVDYATKAGYDVCTTDTNHSFDQGTVGINRLIDRLDSAGIKHVGTYKTQQDSEKPLIIKAKDGKLALITGTVSLNGEVADYDWQVDRMRDDDMHDQDVARVIALAKQAKAQGAVVVLQLHSLQEYITYADSWQVSIAHELAATGLFDFIYFHGSHSAQPIEKYDGIYIAYGVGNTVTESAPPERVVNNQGLTLRVLFSSIDSRAWKVQKIAWLATSNVKNGQYRWCPLVDSASPCISSEQDTAIRNRINNVLHSMNVGVDDKVVVPWSL